MALLGATRLGTMSAPKGAENGAGAVIGNSTGAFPDVDRARAGAGVRRYERARRRLPLERGARRL